MTFGKMFSMADSELTGFETKVLAMIGALQPGDIVTYGEVAAEVGKPGAARAVGSTLRRHGSEVPWWRVVAATTLSGEVPNWDCLCGN